LEKRNCIPDYNDEDIVAAAWRSISLKLSEGARVSSPEFNGAVIGLDKHGRLLVDTGQEIVTCDSTYDLTWSFNS